MGWTFSQEWQTKKELVAELTRKTGSRETIAKSIKGNVLWTVERIRYKAQDGTDVNEKIIACYLISHSRLEGWGYKDMDERMGPSVYSCPLKFFDMVPDPGSYATEWRQKVRAATAKNAALKNVKIGDRVKLVEGCSVFGRPLTEVVITSTKPLLGHVPDGMSNIRISKRYIAEVISS